MNKDSTPSTDAVDELKTIILFQDGIIKGLKESVDNLEQMYCNLYEKHTGHKSFGHKDNNDK